MKNSAYILIAEDDQDDYLLLSDALKLSFGDVLAVWVRDGEQLLHHLKNSPPPSLILLDLNMPRKDGREALKEIRSRKSLSHLPVIILTTSKSEEDVIGSYRAGGNTFIRKPTSFSKLVETMENCRRYWVDTAIIPADYSADLTGS